MHSSETKTVLYIEDNPINVFLVQAIFESHNRVRLLTATHGNIGLELARQYHPDLILLDLNLPDMDGTDYLKQLRADESTAHIPVIIVSAEVMNEQRRQFLNLGVTNYITKPFDIDQFEEIVNRCLEAAQGA